jgi:hypothetical protein
MADNSSSTSNVTVFNFSDPFGATDAAKYPNTHTVPAQIDVTVPLAPQIVTLVDNAAAAAGWSSDDWQTKPFLITMPSLADAGALLLAEMHGRCGYYPSVIRRVKSRFEFIEAEILDLTEVRNEARKRR